MWIIVILVLGPFIYLIVSIIVDSISDKKEEIKRKKYHGEEELFYITTYKNDNITNEDIMYLFNTQIRKYKQHYFNINYEIYKNKEEQNYAWSIKVTKQTFGWGIIYNIYFYFSNGCVDLSFSDNQFISGEKSAQEYYLFGYDFGTVEIENIFKICRDEAKIMWKMNGKGSSNNLPFNFISLSDNKTSTSNSNSTKNNKKEEKSSENSNQFNLLTFYRNLLGLRLHFSHEELKKSYREAVGKYHPDHYGASSSRDRENAEMLMKQVNEAYEKLKGIAV